VKNTAMKFAEIYAFYHVKEVHANRKPNDGIMTLTIVNVKNSLIVVAKAMKTVSVLKRTVKTHAVIPFVGHAHWKRKLGYVRQQN
jgi:hypothetical protein